MVTTAEVGFADDFSFSIINTYYNPEVLKQHYFLVSQIIELKSPILSLICI